MNDTRNEFSRYASLIKGWLAMQSLSTDVPPFSEKSGQLCVERGIVFPLALRGAVPLSPVIELMRPLIDATPGVSDVGVIDRVGHRRRVYRPLLVYCWLNAFRIAYETLPRMDFSRWDEALRGWCDDLESRLIRHPWPPSPLSAASGEAVTEMVWTALALHHAGKIFFRDPWTDLAADAFGHLQRRQSASGSFLKPTAADNPEAHWYHELVILHAAADFAVATEDRALAAAVSRAVEYHVRETQPDHATNQPWGLFALLWNPTGRPLADGMLHTLTLHARAGEMERETTGPAITALSPLTLMLLADALYCLRLFVPELP